MNELVTELRERGNEADIEMRRLNVQRLRHRRQTVTQIATALGVSVPTVSRDLAWLREHWQEMFGTVAKLDASIFIGEALAIYTDIESTAMVDSAKAGLSIRDKMRCLTVAMFARDRAVSLMQDTGVIQRAMGTVNVSLPTAAQIRAAIAQAPFDVDDPSILDVAILPPAPSASDIPPDPTGVVDE